MAQPGERRRHAVTDVVRLEPRVACRLGRTGLAGPGRRRGLRLLPGRLPPGTRRPAGGGMEGLGAGAVGPRVEPRLPPVPGRAALGGRGHRRARRGGAVRPVPPPARPGVAPGLDRLSRPECARRPSTARRGGAGHLVVGAVALVGCAGPEESGTPAARVSAWVSTPAAGRPSAPSRSTAPTSTMPSPTTTRRPPSRGVRPAHQRRRDGHRQPADARPQLTDDLNNAYQDGHRGR